MLNGVSFLRTYCTPLERRKTSDTPKLITRKGNYKQFAYKDKTTKMDPFLLKPINVYVKPWTEVS